MRIEDSIAFVKKYCKDGYSCGLLIEVENLGNEASRFNVGFVDNEAPLVLKEGE